MKLRRIVIPLSTLLVAGAAAPIIAHTRAEIAHAEKVSAERDLVASVSDTDAGAAPEQTRPLIPPPTDSLLGEPLDGKLAAEIEDMLTSGFLRQELGGDVAPGAIDAARAVYARQLFEPVWNRDGAEALADFGAQLFDYGVASEETLERDIDALIADRFEGGKAARAKADILMTSAFLRMLGAISGGLMDEGEVVRVDESSPAIAALPAAIKSAGKGDLESQIQQFEPDHPQYWGLRRVLQDYREILHDGGWRAIPSGGLIRPGDSDPRVPLLRDRLTREGYDVAQPSPELTEPAPEALYDDGLVAAVERFQKRHGLEVDGVIGPQTLDAMNESVSSKIDRIADAMYRWRKQGDMGARYIWANIPSFTAEGWSDGVKEISSKTVVGRRGRETPVFSDEVEYIVANPKWYVPVSIARRDKRPKLSEDPSYALRKGYRVYERASGVEVSAAQVDWSDPESVNRYRLVQQPGEDNALGALKIIFPNQYSVYLHDTPSRSLFDEASRAFSSGCVRLERPVEMARWVAGKSGEDLADRIDDALKDVEQDKHIPLRKSVQIHITYMTVTVDDTGAPYFWRDIYGRHDGIIYAEQYAPMRDVAESEAETTNSDMTARR